MLSKEQNEQLKQNVNPEAFRNRLNNDIEGYSVINTANRIFGFDGWSYLLDELDFRNIGQYGIVEAQVTVQVKAGGDSITRSDVGSAIPTGDSAQAYEIALKGAVTDAIKRAFRSFGPQFGLELYDTDNSLHAFPGSSNGQTVPSAQLTDPDQEAKPRASITAGTSEVVACEACGEEISESKKYSVAHKVNISRKRCDGHILCFDHQNEYPHCLDSSLAQAA